MAERLKSNFYIHRNEHMQPYILLSQNNHTVRQYGQRRTTLRKCHINLARSTCARRAPLTCSVFLGLRAALEACTRHTQRPRGVLCLHAAQMRAGSVLRDLECILGLHTMLSWSCSSLQGPTLHAASSVSCAQRLGLARNVDMTWRVAPLPTRQLPAPGCFLCVRDAAAAGHRSRGFSHEKALRRRCTSLQGC